uniref:Uncharacterized protein n=1 Tax=Acrobeloides nanus TaxID=290746 RepID=A0A914C663_9BILA
MLYALNDYIGNVRDKEDRRQVGWKGMYQKLREAAEKVYEYYDEFYDITSDDIESGRIYRYAKCEMSFWKRLMGRCASTH